MRYRFRFPFAAPFAGALSARSSPFSAVTGSVAISAAARTVHSSDIRSITELSPLSAESVGRTSTAVWLTGIVITPLRSGAAVGAPDKIADTNTERYIRIESDQVQKNYTLNLASEITENLLGINPADVCYVKITLAAGSNDKDAEGTLTVSDLVLKYYL